MHHLYRWKGRVIRGMVQSKLEPPYRQKASLDDALDVFFHAVTLREHAKAGPHMRWLPMQSAGSMLHSVLTHKRHLYGAVETKRYEKFKQHFTLYARDFGERIKTVFDEASLDLFHPEKPSGYPLFKAIRQLFGPDISAEEERFLDSIKYTGRAKRENDLWFSMMVGVLHALQAQGYRTEATWLRDVIAQTFPDLDRFTDHDLRGLVDGSNWSMFPNVAPAPKREVGEPVRVPFPSFT
ncbi:hypothetical protein B0A55_07134 [Friedmanniomyces simplex]|uniref:Uncharacterized protein n=1 Tax=Friedmanniomyces simplex TaxID=329884 RepID=A0A4U0X5Z3_9PEZI|nr:hypothetical protein B0A55_07134 [Friedmanniomyces simplex]